MNYKYLYFKTLLTFSFWLLLAFGFVGCSIKKPIKSQSATILLKTPNMKFYDKGFILKYNNMIDLNILNAGASVLHLEIYKDRVCSSTFKCLSSKEFNKQYLNQSYDDEFLYKLFSTKKVYFKDKKNHILIKVIPD